MLGGHPVRQKSSEKVCFMLIKAVNVQHFHSAQHVSWTSIHAVSLVHESVWFLYNPTISGFNNVFPFIYIFIDHPCARTYFLCLLLSAALYIVFNPMFTMCVF